MIVLLDEKKGVGVVPQREISSHEKAKAKAFKIVDQIENSFQVSVSAASASVLMLDSYATLAHTAAYGTRPTRPR
jgi:D-Tyr-tRNAtyr deacylase